MIPHKIEKIIAAGYGAPSAENERLRDDDAILNAFKSKNFSVFLLCAFLWVYARPFSLKIERFRCFNLRYYGFSELSAKSMIWCKCIQFKLILGISKCLGNA